MIANAFHKSDLNIWKKTGVSIGTDDKETVGDDENEGLTFDEKDDEMIIMISLSDIPAATIDSQEGSAFLGPVKPS